MDMNPINNLPVEPPTPNRFKQILGLFASKKVYLTCLGLCIVAITGICITLVYDGPKEEVSQNNNQQNQTNNQPNDNLPNDVPLPSPTEAKLKYTASDNKNGAIFGLSDGNKIWLERTEYSWDKYELWENWIFYLTVPEADQAKLENGIDKISYTLSAFNLLTKKYVDISTITMPDSIAGVAALDIQADHLYIRVGGYRALGSTYRCRLNKDESCTNFGELYSKQGYLYDYRTYALIADSFGDAGYSSSTLKKFVYTTKTESVLKNVSANQGHGQAFITADSNGLMWFIDGGKYIEPGSTEPKPVETYSRLYAIDDTGAEVKSLKASDLNISSIGYASSSSNNQDIINIRIGADEGNSTYNTVTGEIATATADDGTLKPMADRATDAAKKLGLPTGWSFQARRNPNEPEEE